MKTLRTKSFFLAVLFAGFVIAGISQTSAGVILDINGTPGNTTITASVNNGDSFASDFGGNLLFFLAPNIYETEVFIAGANGSANPWIIRGPLDGSYLNVVRISLGDMSPFTLDQNNPITSSPSVVLGDISSLAAFDGVSSSMSRISGSGPNTEVTLNYNVSTAVPEPSSMAVFVVAILGVVRRRRTRNVGSL